MLAGKAIGFVRRARGPFFLYFAPVAPHLPAIPAPRDLASRRRCRGRGRTSTSPTSATSRGTGSTAAIRRRRCTFLDRDIEGRQLGSLLEVDRQVGAIVPRSKQQQRARQHDRGLHERQRLPLGRAPARREALAVRGVDPRAARRSARRGSTQRRVDRDLALNIDLASTIAQLAGVRPDAAAGRPQPRAAAARRVAAVAATSSSRSTSARARSRTRGPPPFRASARSAGCTSSTRTAGASCTTSSATRTSSEPRARPALAALRGRLHRRLTDARAPLERRRARSTAPSAKPVRLVAVERDDLLEDRERLGPLPRALEPQAGVVEAARGTVAHLGIGVGAEAREDVLVRRRRRGRSGPAARARCRC